jgi:hypothetical protein
MTSKQLHEAESIEAKQRKRMSDLQDELATTIKRIEQLQRGQAGGGGFGSGAIGS